MVWSVVFEPLLWDSIVRYKTERGSLGSKTGYSRLVTVVWSVVFEPLLWP